MHFIKIVFFTLVYIPAHLFLSSSEIFRRMEYTCSFEAGVVILQGFGITAVECGRSCSKDSRCYSFQYDKQSQYCTTTTQILHDIQTCHKATDDNEVVYVKGE